MTRNHVVQAYSFIGSLVSKKEAAAAQAAHDISASCLQEKTPVKIYLGGPTNELGTELPASLIMDEGWNTTLDDGLGRERKASRAQGISADFIRERRASIQSRAREQGRG